MSEKLLFYFISEDEAYFRVLEAEFKKLSKIPVTFKRLFETEESKIQSLFIKIYSNTPACVFVDFSKHTPDYLHLARLLTRTRFEHKMLIVGMLDLLTSADVLSEALATGIHLAHYKSPETYDVVYDVTKLLAPEQMGEHGFATADVKEGWTAGVLCKVGFVHAEGLHMETDFPLSAGQVIHLNHCWKDNKIIPSKQVEVKSVKTENLFYQFKYGVDAEFKFIDEVVPDPVLAVEDLQSRQEDRKELIRRSKKLFHQWLEDNDSLSQEKICKVLVIDKDFHFYNNQARSDKHPYLIRIVPQVKDIDYELNRIYPQVIAVALEDETVASSVNHMNFVKSLVNNIQKRDKALWPYLVLFNAKSSSKDLQNDLGYPQLMAAQNELSVDVLVRMAGAFEKKLLEARDTHMEKKALQVFIKKSNPASLADFDMSIDMVKISETDVIFRSTVEIPPGTNLKIRKPVPMVIHVQPMKSQSKVPEYQGFIHCLDEVHKKELRRYVNSIFFRDHDAQLSNENEEFRKLNEAKLQEKMEALKKQQEAEEEAKKETGS